MAYAKLGRTQSARKALFRSLATSLLANERIVTTHGKATEVDAIVEKLITLAKRNDLHARRQAASFLFDEDVLKKLFDKIGPRYAERAGGYTRIIQAENRRGDAAPMVYLELV
ncbi:MAG: 50S ribosomal protein L17 [Bacillota bacterium]|nr:50S ribosomal protein L17 [Bacillota bacterium]